MTATTCALLANRRQDAAIFYKGLASTQAEFLAASDLDAVDLVIVSSFSEPDILIGADLIGANLCKWSAVKGRLHGPMSRFSGP